jgi:F-type H+-transporting ATPase subunit b
MGHEPVLIPDQTMLIQLALFMASYYVLRFLVFKPYIALLQERREKTLGMKERAQSDQSAADLYKTQYEEFLRGEKKKISEYSEAERRKIAEEEKRIIDQARASASKQQQAVAAALSAEFEQSRSELKGRVPEFASQLASKILGRKVQVQASATSRSARVKEESVPG